MEAYFCGSRGHTFTDMPADYRSSFAEVLELGLSDNAGPAFFVASAVHLLAYERICGYAS